MILWYKSKFTIFIMNPNLKAFVVCFKRENLPRCFISTHLCICVCVCISQLVYMYMYIIYIKHFIFFHTSMYAFIIQIIKMGEGFCFFLNRWRNLEDQKLDLIEFWCSFSFFFFFFLFKFYCSAMEDGFFFFPNNPLTLKFIFKWTLFLLVFIFVFVFEEITKPSCLQSDKGYSNGLNLPVVGRCFKNTSCVWIVAERFPWQCEEENSFCPIIINSWIECWFDLQA